MSHWMFNCEQVSEMVSASLDRTLPFHQRAMIRIHLLMCKYCARFKDQLVVIRDACRLDDLCDEDFDSTDPLPPDARDRLKQTLASAMGEHK